MMRKILFLLPFLLVLVIPLSSLAPTQEQPELSPIKVILTGDLMLDRGIEYIIEKQGSGDFRFPFLKIADYLNKADIVFGNLEGPISDKGEKVGSIYSFRNDPRAIEGLTYANFNVLSLTNNHAFDYGRKALEDCLTRLTAAGINYVGAGFSEKEAFSPIVKEINGTKIGFLAYTNLGPETWQANGENSGIAWIDDSVLGLAKHNIEEAEKLVDVLIVSLHAGEEYQKTPTQFQIDFAKMAREAGADIVVNHHPHVIQQNLYSLGNFVFDQSFSEETMKGLLLEVTVDDKKIEKIEPKEIQINDYFQPTLN